MATTPETNHLVKRWRPHLKQITWWNDGDHTWNKSPGETMATTPETNHLGETMMTTPETNHLVKRWRPHLKQITRWKRWLYSHSDKPPALTGDSTPESKSLRWNDGDHTWQANQLVKRSRLYTWKQITRWNDGDHTWNKSISSNDGVHTWNKPLGETMATTPETNHVGEVGRLNLKRMVGDWWSITPETNHQVKRWRPFTWFQISRWNNG